MSDSASDKDSCEKMTDLAVASANDELISVSICSITA